MLDQKTQKALTQANQRLKAGKVGLTIQRQNNRLYLRGVLPPRRGEGKSKQRRLSLGILANLAGVQRAEAEAYQVAHAIAMEKFDWADWIESEKPNPMIKNAIARYKEDYFNVRPRTPKTQTTWDTDYHSVCDLRASLRSYSNSATSPYTPIELRCNPNAF